MKTMGKVGLCTVESYSGGEFFEPNFLNTDDPIFRRYFPNMKSPVGGVGFIEVAQAMTDWHQHALDCHSENDIPMLGLFKERAEGAGHSYGITAVRGFVDLTEEKIAFDLAMQILSNYEETGFFDKLRDNDKLMAAQAIDLSFNEYGASIILFIPKLIGQKLQSAENIVLAEISKLKNGEFSEEFLDAIKINKLKEFSLQWENNQNRALEMVNAFMLGKNWDEYYNNYYGTLIQIDKEEVVRVCLLYTSDAADE